MQLFQNTKYYFCCFRCKKSLSISDQAAALDQVFMWCMVFLGLGVFIFIGALNQTYFFTKVGANLTQRIR